MITNLIPAQSTALATRSLGKLSLGWKKHGPTVCFVAGLAGAVGAGVLGATQWQKAKTIIDKKLEEKEKILKNFEEKKTVLVNGEETEYSEQMRDADLVKVQKSTVIEVAKTMAPPVGLGLASAALMIGGYAGRTRQLASMTAYASTLQTIIEQRDKIFRKEFGDEKVDMLYAGYTKETKEVLTEDENGNKIVELQEELVKKYEVPADGVFRFHFKRGCAGWRAGAREMNYDQISIGAQVLTNELCKYGHITIEDVYRVFRIPEEDRSPAGMICGKLFTGEEFHDKIVFKIDEFNSTADDIWFTLDTDGLILPMPKTETKAKKSKKH